MAQIDLSKDLENLKKAKMQLMVAINGTVASWPHVEFCWIDQINEPTKLLARHRLPPGTKEEQ